MFLYILLFSGLSGKFFQLNVEKQKLYYCQIKVLLDTVNFWYRMILL